MTDVTLALIRFMAHLNLPFWTWQKTETSTDNLSVGDMMTMVRNQPIVIGEPKDGKIFLRVDYLYPDEHGHKQPVRQLLLLDEYGPDNFRVFTDTLLTETEPMFLFFASRREIQMGLRILKQLNLYKLKESEP